jgi:predicted ATPase
MLRRLELEGFKSFADAKVDLAPLTFLVGANASGKSNFVDALRVLKGLAIGLTLPEVLEGRRVGETITWGGIRGGLAEAAFVGSHRFAVIGDWEVEDTVEEVDAGVPARPGLVKIRDRVDVGTATPTVSRSRLGAIPGYATGWLDAALQRIEFLDPHPGRMRGFGNVDGPLGVEGENLSGLLGSIASDPARKEVVVEWIRELCAPEIQNIDFIRVPELRQIMLAIEEEHGVRISARSLSDGTLRFLYLIVALRLLHPSPLVVIEDVDTGLHPTRLGKLVELLESVAREGKTQIIATTHSPTLLEWLPRDTLDSVVLCARTREQRGTILKRVGDLAHFHEVVARKSFHELFATGWLEMAV